jgi:hypothetical protein
MVNGQPDKGKKAPKWVCPGATPCPLAVFAKEGEFKKASNDLKNRGIFSAAANTQAPDSYLPVSIVYLLLGCGLRGLFFYGAPCPLIAQALGFIKTYTFWLFGGFDRDIRRFLYFLFFARPLVNLVRGVSGLRCQMHAATRHTASCLVPGPPRTATATGHRVRVRVRAVCRVSASACRCPECPVPSAQRALSPEPREPSARPATRYLPLMSLS